MGHLEVITGPMFSGKTEELLRRLRRLQIANKNVTLVKPAIDKRYGEDFVISHSGYRMSCSEATSSSEVLDIGQYVDAIGIEEVQFFPESLINVVLHLAREITVVVSGLDTNFKYEPWTITTQLMAYADKLDKLTAICNSCGEEATRTQRLLDGEPITYGPDVLVGGTETYEARCRECFKLA